MLRTNRLRLLIYTMVLATWSAGCGGDKPAPSKDDPPDARKDPAPKNDLGEAKFKLTADELHSEAEKDSKAVAAKYHNAVVELSGKVADVEGIGWRDQLSISLQVKGRLGLNCLIKDTRLPGKLARHQAIRLKGRVRATGVATELIDGEIVELGPDTAIRVSAEEMARQFNSKPEEAAEKYNDRTVVITGVIAKKEPKPPYHRVVELKGDGTTVVECEFEGLEAEEAKLEDAKLKVGQKVTLAGIFSRSFTGRSRPNITKTLIVEAP